MNCLAASGGLGAMAREALGPADLAMPSLVEAFQHNPFFMLGSLACAFLGALAALVAFAARRRSRSLGLASSAVAIGFGVLALGCGLFGFYRKTWMTEGLLSGLELGESDRRRLAEVAGVEASYDAKVGAALGVVTVLIGVGAMMAVRRAKQTGR